MSKRERPPDLCGSWRSLLGADDAFSRRDECSDSSRAAACLCFQQTERLSAPFHSRRTE